MVVEHELTNLIQRDGFRMITVELHLEHAAVAVMIRVSAECHFPVLLIVVNECQYIAAFGLDLCGTRLPIADGDDMAGTELLAGAGISSVDLCNIFFLGEAQNGFFRRHVAVQIVHDKQRGADGNDNDSGGSEKEDHIVQWLWSAPQVQEEQQLDRHLQHADSQDYRQQHVAVQNLIDHQVIRDDRKYQ